jgi:putative oxidoreductase
MNAMQTSRPAAPIRLVLFIIAIMQSVPFWLVALTARIALGEVFWSSAQEHLGNWDTTLYQFEETFQVPLLPPDLAANMAVAIELCTPPLLLLGLGTRFASLVLLGMTLVIEIFVFPMAWPTHIQWAGLQLLLISQGGGAISLDALIRRRCAPRG